MSVFSPQYGANQTIATGVLSVSVAINPHCQAVRLVNSGVELCYVRLGEGTLAATAADTPIPPDTDLVLRKGYGESTLAVISPGGAGELQVQTGEVPE
jgi:hypothetical protein